MEIRSKNIWNNSQEEQLIKALNSAALVSITDPKGIIIYVNDKFCKIAGYSEQELLGQNHRILKSGKQPDSFFKNMWASISSKTIWRGDICNKRKDGSLYWVNATIIPFTNNHGEIEKYVAIRFDTTSSKKNAKNFEIMQNKFTSIFNSANDAILIVDIDTRKIINVNDKAKELLGYTKSEFIGMSNYNLYPKKNIAFIKQKGAYLIANNNVIFETQHVHKNGSLIDVEISCKVFNDGSQEVFQSIVRDISSRKKIENKLRESEINNKLLIENTPYCIHRLDHNGNILSMNSTGLKMMNLTKEEEIIGQNYVDLFKDSLKPKIQRLLNKAVKGKGSEFEFTTDFGQTWASSFIPIIGETDGIKLMGITLDITEQRKKEQLVKDSEEKFKLIFDSAPDAYFICDLNSVILNCNTAAVAMCGYTKKELINNSITDSTIILSETDRDFFIKTLKVPSKKPRQFEFKITSKEGKKMDVELISHSVVLDGKKLVLNIAHDITERKTTLNELQEKTQDLELFLYRASHDLRSPFTSLEGLLNIIRYQPVNEDTKELLDMFESALNSGKVLIDNLASSSAMLNNSIEMELVDFNKLLKSTLVNLKYIDGFESIKFNINTPKNLKFYSNPLMLCSILQNLLQNAIKYQRPSSENHTPFIIINALKTKNGIKISIKDNGLGISKSDLTKVFDLYYRSNSTVDGTGLGLYITKNAVEQLKGTISAESILNKETQFDIILKNPSL